MIVLEINLADHVSLRSILVAADTPRIVLVSIVSDASGSRDGEVAEDLVLQTELDSFIFELHAAHSIVHEGVEIVVVESATLHSIPDIGVITLDRTAEVLVVPGIAEVGSQVFFAFEHADRGVFGAG